MTQLQGIILRCSPAFSQNAVWWKPIWGRLTLNGFAFTLPTKSTGWNQSTNLANASSGDCLVSCGAGNGGAQSSPAVVSIHPASRACTGQRTSLPDRRCVNLKVLFHSIRQRPSDTGTLVVFKIVDEIAVLSPGCSTSRQTRLQAMQQRNGTVISK